MTTRTTETTVTFTHPFQLGDLDELFPAGTYRLTLDEEPIVELSFEAWRRIAAFIELPATPGQPGTTRTLTVAPNDLDKARQRDRELADMPVARRAG